MTGRDHAWPTTRNVTVGGGGGSGIRTHDTVARIHAFQASAFSHSAIPPLWTSANIDAGPSSASGLGSGGIGRKRLSLGGLSLAGIRPPLRCRNPCAQYIHSERLDRRVAPVHLSLGMPCCLSSASWPAS